MREKREGRKNPSLSVLFFFITPHIYNRTICRVRTFFSTLSYFFYCLLYFSFCSRINYLQEIFFPLVAIIIYCILVSLFTSKEPSYSSAYAPLPKMLGRSVKILDNKLSIILYYVLDSRLLFSLSDRHHYHIPLPVPTAYLLYCSSSLYLPSLLLIVV